MIHVWLTVVGGMATGIIAAAIVSGVDFDLSGPIIVAAVIAVGAFGLGIALLGIHGRIDRDVIRLLRDRPDRVERVYPKITESTVYGRTIAGYQWLVVKDVAGRAYSIYAAHDTPAVVREILTLAPRARYDPTLHVERVEVQL